jgi:hypothetical protein
MSSEKKGSWPATGASAAEEKQGANLADIQLIGMFFPG